MKIFNALKLSVHLGTVLNELNLNFENQRINAYEILCWLSDDELHKCFSP
jgi:hypothetical protein